MGSWGYPKVGLFLRVLVGHVAFKWKLSTGFSAFRWLVGWWVGGLVGWLAGWLAGWLVGWLYANVLRRVCFGNSFCPIAYMVTCGLSSDWFGLAVVSSSS